MKEKIIKFIIDNIYSVILTDSFASLLKNLDLSLEVLRIFATNKNPNIIKTINNFNQSSSSLN